MMDMMVDWASRPETAGWVLAGAVTILVVEAIRQSRTALWGDFFGDEAEEE